MHCGDTFLMAPLLGLDPHLWIIVTEADANGDVVIANVTTLQESADQTVILRKGNHPFIHHDSVVRFGDARIVKMNSIKAQLTAATIQPREACSKELLAEIQAGVLASDHTPRKVITFCRKAWGK